MTVPEFRKGYQSLQADVVETRIRAGWHALEEKLCIAYHVELVDVSRAVARAEWLARGIVLTF
jgi:hypothetical protein